MDDDGIQILVRQVEKGAKGENKEKPSDEKSKLVEKNEALDLVKCKVCIVFNFELMCSKNTSLFFVNIGYGLMFYRLYLILS